jgi:hypothetical protein
MSAHRDAVEQAIERYVAMLRREAPASAQHQRRPREEAAAYGLGLCRALAALEEADGVTCRRSVALAVEVVAAARAAQRVEIAPKRVRERRFPHRHTGAHTVPRAHTGAQRGA